VTPSTFRARLLRPDHPGGGRSKIVESRLHRSSCRGRRLRRWANADGTTLSPTVTAATWRLLVGRGGRGYGDLGEKAAVAGRHGPRRARPRPSAAGLGDTPDDVGATFDFLVQPLERIDRPDFLQCPAGATFGNRRPSRAEQHRRDRLPQPEVGVGDVQRCTPPSPHAFSERGSPVQNGRPHSRRRRTPALRGARRRRSRRRGRAPPEPCILLVEITADPRDSELGDAGIGAEGVDQVTNLAGRYPCR
jgi:hypothetical protein